MEGNTHDIHIEGKITYLRHIHGEGIHTYGGDIHMKATQRHIYTAETYTKEEYIMTDIYTTYNT